MVALFAPFAHPLRRPPASPPASLPALPPLRDSADPPPPPAPRPPPARSGFPRAQDTSELELSMDASTLAEAEGKADDIVAALMTTVSDSSLSEMSNRERTNLANIALGADVVVTAARRRLLASFKATITFRGAAGDMQTLNTFFASAPSITALLATLQAQGITATRFVAATVNGAPVGSTSSGQSSAAASDESWIGIPIGCSLARGTLAARHRPRRCTCEPPCASAQARADKAAAPPATT